MLCPVCRDKVENGKCTFCGYVLTPEELKKARTEDITGEIFGAKKDYTLNESKSTGGVLNDCKGHSEHKLNECDDHSSHNIGGTQYKKNADGSYSQKDYSQKNYSQDGVGGFGEELKKDFHNSAADLKKDVIDLMGGAGSKTNGSYGPNVSNGIPGSSSYSSDRNANRMYGITIAFAIFFPIVGIVLAVMQMKKASSEQEQKKYKTALIIAAVLLGFNFIGSFLPLLFAIVASFIN